MRISKLINSLFLFGGGIIGLTFMACLLAPGLAQAAALPTGDQAKISFTFDDGLASTYANAEPVLQQNGLTGTDYVITGCVGMTAINNTCRANTDTTYMTWAQIQALQNSDGWEIGSHTVDHDCLASSAAVDPDDCQTSILTQAQVDLELSQSQSALATNGITATDFAPPYGDYNNMVLAQIAKYYSSMRGFKDQNNNVWPYDEYLVNDFTVLEKTDPVATVEAKIDQAIASNQWLVLTFHDIETKPSTNPDNYQYGTSELSQIAAYVKAKETAGLITNVNVNKGYVSSNTNMLANGSFNDGIADGWTTDDSAYITKDTLDNGSYPDPTNSIKLTSDPSGKNGHLFSPKVAVNPTTEYLFKDFLNVQAITSGEVAFYIDEYNANGQWISGQYLKRENSAFVENLNFAYTPSSVNVAYASLQVIVTGTGITAYLDNVQMFPVLTTTPTATNLMTNSTFDSGISAGWTTDSPSGITANSANNGSPTDPVNSIKLVAGTTSANTHLFSPKITVSSTNSYTIDAWLNLLTCNSGEVAFYIDEYNAQGQWISGQYKLGVYTIGTHSLGFTYTPSSSNVTSAALQIIVVGNSGITGYLDDVQWYQN